MTATPANPLPRARPRQIGQNAGVTQDGTEQARQFSERIFFNCLAILKGVVLAYGATVLIALIRRGAPWASGQLLSIYLAWATTMALVTLTFVSQALGSTQTPLRPTTFVILITFVLSMTEFIAFGLLEPHPGERLEVTVRYWFLGVAATSGVATLFATTVLRQMRSSHFPEVSNDARTRSDTQSDQIGAGLHCLLAVTMWFILAIPMVMTRFSWVPVSVLGIGTCVGLARQQSKIEITRPEPGQESPSMPD